MARVAGRFTRVESRRTARRMVAGLASELPNKNCWTLSEQAGDDTPDAMQNLLSRASWDTEGVGADLRGYVVEHLGGTDAILVVDETGDLKKGTHTVGTQRQYTGTAGRIENAQVAVHLTYSTDMGHTFIDRALYLPKSWTEDAQRCAAAGIPDDTTFATKPALATRMITEALDAGVPARWVTGDEVYGADPALRKELETREVAYVLAIGRDRRVDTATGPARPDTLAAELPKQAWQRLSAGDGAKGPRIYDWAWIDVNTDTAATGCRWLLVRRNPNSGELAYYRCYAPHPVPLSALVAVAGRRWAVEEDFQSGKGLAGLDEHQVRRWTSWHRWTMLSMLALALLTVLAARERAAQPAPEGLIPLTRNEIQHLFVTFLIRPILDIGLRLRRSIWRRRHQQRAKTSHYRRRSEQARVAR
ncbi:IS701 family transposase [Nocardia beijingensis]|uniref:IS701 family transposase n=1 Tax=Nocardia beijingensis TaxID=95162 RepID=UPI001894ABE6|nr:IS701 family transposase [Nocardia beijingensis]MBF6470116.1 IS701 family transposase [Nocardia beijingensis]